jgi:tetratricopeptide (TPR) repeat protein
MDLLDFTGEDMYFDRPLPAEVEGLIADAAEHYGEDRAEHALMRAYFLAPGHLSVLVALYRFFYYRQRYDEALTVADRALAEAGRELGFGADWRVMTDDDLGRAAAQSMTLTRFVLLALKGAGFLLMRMDRPAEALERFEKAAAFDSSNRLGLTELLDWARKAVAKSDAEAAGANVHFFRR